jgi:hypothetical protein
MNPEINNNALICFSNFLKIKQNGWKWEKRQGKSVWKNTPGTAT